MREQSMVLANQVNDGMNRMGFSYDSKSFLMDGKRIYLNSAAIHYFRMPKEEWREVLVKAKLAGMNCIDTYFAWNVHEPREGEWNFEGDNDCGEFLDLCAELGLWVIARPGPFICAEWDFGGFPWWLTTKEGIQFRAYNDVYLHYVDLYFDQIVPIIHSRQLTNGGTVILVQVENEYGYLADDETARQYMHHLRDGLLNRGIDVPLITCVGGAEGTIEGANFWSNADEHFAKLSAKQPDTPKIVTEFWTGWFEHWGASAATQKTSALYEKRMMETLQAGFTGLSHYMFYGGTNFGGYGGRTVGSSDIFMVTSYDYDAPLNEYSRVTPKYQSAKTFSYFTHALSDFLLVAENVMGDMPHVTEGLRIRGRSREKENLWFVENVKEERETFYVTLAENRTIPVTVKPGQIVPIADRIEILPGVLMTCSSLLLGNEMIEGVHTLILSADHGQRSYFELESEVPIESDWKGTIRYEMASDHKAISFDLCHFQDPQEISLRVGEQKLRIIVLNRTMSERTWRVKDGEGNVHWLIGYEDIRLELGNRILGVPGDDGATLLHLGIPDEWNVIELAFLDQKRLPKLPDLSDWTSNPVEFKAVGDMKKGPVDFASMSQDFGYLLYQSELRSDSERDTTLVISKIQDTARVFVNGFEQALITQLGSSAVNLKLREGINHIQILVQHMGRLNFSPYLGEQKGISGVVYRDGQSQDLRRGWKAESELIHLDEVVRLPDQTPIRRTFQLVNGHDRAILVGAISSPLKINGQEVSMPEYHNWFSHQTLDISDYLNGATNTIEMVYCKSPLNRLELLTYDQSAELYEWNTSTLGPSLTEVGDPKSTGTFEIGPTCYRCTFQKPTEVEGLHPKIKLRLTGMGKGVLWLNGINIGRYWQVGPQEDYKIPLAWLRDHNELFIFDEEGRSPERIRLLYDEQSDRNWIQINLNG